MGGIGAIARAGQIVQGSRGAQGWKRSVFRHSTRTGFPATVGGVNRAMENAFRAAAPNPHPVDSSRTRTRATLPSVLTSSSRRTVPDLPSRRARAG